MARIDLAKLTKAQLLALIATRDTAAPSEASQHFADRDLPCTFAKPCDRTFRTVKGQTWHKDNMVKQHA